MVKCIIDLAHNLGVTAIAEGVENEQILTALAGIGCDLVQGYPCEQANAGKRRPAVVESLGGAARRAEWMRA